MPFYGLVLWLAIWAQPCHQVLNDGQWHTIRATSDGVSIQWKLDDVPCSEPLDRDLRNAFAYFPPFSNGDRLTMVVTTNPEAERISVTAGRLRIDWVVWRHDAERQPPTDTLQPPVPPWKQWKHRLGPSGKDGGR